MMIDSSYILSVLDYNHLTGIFTWRDGKRGKGENAYKGKIAGVVNRRGYVQIKIKGKAFLAHRLAWLFSHGTFPPMFIDHINRIKSDNRIENLRPATATCNQRNIGLTRANKSQVKGVFYLAGRNRWTARIRDGRHPLELGTFEHFEDAVCARLAGEQCLGFNECDSLSSAEMYVRINIQKRPLSQMTKERLLELMDQDNVPEAVRTSLFNLFERSQNV